MSRREKHIFRFRRFAMTDDRSAMKIGTDGVLLGAWADATHARNILDVGTGCGLISLMMAQRFPFAHIDAVEIDAQALADALENIATSPFAKQINAFPGDFLTFDFFPRYDSIVSNPPFFPENTLSPDVTRAVARNASALPAGPFARKIGQLLTDTGRASVIYPCDHADEVIRLFLENGLHLSRRTDVKGAPHRPAKRSLLEFSRLRIENPAHDVLCLCDADGHRSEQYQGLTRDFHPED